MRYGMSLFFEQQRTDMKEARSKIEQYSPISWDEVLSAGFNCVWNQDHTGTSFQGEIESIKREGNQIILTCKWIKALEPFFDEDGDLDQDRMWWRPWNVKETRFSTSTIPRKVPNSSKVIIQCSFGPDQSTTTTLAIVEKFSSLN